MTEPPGSPGAGPGLKRILLVEDDVHTRRINSKALSSHGFEIHEAPDGAEAIRLAMELRPDLVVMDLGLPGTSGIEATRRIKESLQPSPPIIVVLSAHAMKGDLEAARAAGCDAFLAKPIDPFDLVHEVKRRIGPKEAAR